MSKRKLTGLEPVACLSAAEPDPGHPVMPPTPLLRSLVAEFDIAASGPRVDPVFAGVLQVVAFVVSAPDDEFERLFAEVEAAMPAYDRLEKWHKRKAGR